MEQLRVHKHLVSETFLALYFFTLTLMLLLRFFWKRWNKIVIIFYLSILASVRFNLYSSSRESILKNQVDHSTVWVVFINLSQVRLHKTIFILFSNPKFMEWKWFLELVSQAPQLEEKIRRWMVHICAGGRRQGNSTTQASQSKVFPASGKTGVFVF